MADFGKVAVLMGGRSAEREISLMTGANVLEALKRKGVNAYGFDPAERPLSELAGDGVKRVFIALHGRFGEDGTVQGALEIMEIPYTGSGVMASALCLDKLRTKLVWQASGIPTPRGEVITAATDWSALAGRLGLPLIIKPAHEGSSIGISKVKAIAEIAAAYALAAKHDPLVTAHCRWCALKHRPAITTTRTNISATTPSITARAACRPRRSRRSRRSSCARLRRSVALAGGAPI